MLTNLVFDDEFTVVVGDVPRCEDVMSVKFPVVLNVPGSSHCNETLTSAVTDITDGVPGVIAGYAIRLQTVLDTRPVLSSPM